MIWIGCDMNEYEWYDMNMCDVWMIWIWYEWMMLWYE